MRKLITVLALMLMATTALAGGYISGGGASETNNIGTSTTATGGTYVLGSSDYIVFVETDELVTVTLPTSITTTGRIVLIKDSTGGAFDFPVTIDTEGTALLDGDASIQIFAAHNSYTLICDGTNWFIF